MNHLLPHLAAIRADGADVLDFLHRQLSADILGLGDGDATFACLCQPKGRVIALLMVTPRRDGEGAWIVCADSLADKVRQWLSRFVFRDDVQFANDITEVPCTAAPDDDHALVPIPGFRGLAYRLAPAGEADAGAVAAFRARELAAGVAWLDDATSEAFLPQMLGTEHIGALNFRKGCYPGQEIVARTHYLGKLKQRPVLACSGARIEVAPMEAVTLVHAGEEGEVHIDARVVDAVPDGDGTRLLLVARAGKAPAADHMVDKLVRSDSEFPVETRWPEPAQASATT